MYNDLLTIGPVTIHGYGLMTAMGILAAYFSAEYRAKKKGLDSSKVFGLVVCCVALGYVCSKALYLITVLPDILADPSIFWSSLANGWVVLGGILQMEKAARLEFLRRGHGQRGPGPGIRPDRLFSGRLLLRSGEPRPFGRYLYGF